MIAATNQCILKNRVVVGDSVTIVQVSIGVAIFILVLTAVIERTSFSAFWLMVNQLQLTSLLGLTGVYVPHEVTERIKGVEFASFLFSFIPVIDIFPDGAFKKWIDFEQTDQKLTDIGLESGSTFVSSFTLLIILLLLTI